MRFLALLCCLLISTAAFAKESKTATVNLQKLFKAYPPAQRAEKKFAALAEAKKKELEPDAKALQALQNELKEKGDKMPAAEKKKKAKEFEKEAKAFEKNKNEIEKELETERRAMSMKVSDEIKALVAKVAKNSGANLVLDSDKAVYMEEGVDLTDEVLKLFPKDKSDSSDSDSGSK